MCFAMNEAMNVCLISAIHSILTLVEVSWKTESEVET